MTEVSVAQEEKIQDAPSVIIENCTANDDKEQPKQTHCSAADEEADGNGSAGASSPKSTGAKVKRKMRSTRRRLNALMNNTSLHFSDTDSEGELTMMMPLPTTMTTHQTLSVAPAISVTLSDDDGRALSDQPSIASTRRGSFVENLTDVDEIYASDPETDSKPPKFSSLQVDEDNRGGETDLEDFSNEEDDDDCQATVYVTPRSDILCDFSGEMITTKEGDGPFSVEIRNRMSEEAVAFKKEKAGGSRDNPEVLVMPNTDSEDMDVSDEDDLQVASCSRRDILEDFDVLAASQIVMTNVNKADSTLSAQENAEEAGVSESHTDTEDVE